MTDEEAVVECRREIIRLRGVLREIYEEENNTLYYVLVCDKGCYDFVTSVDIQHNSAQWKHGEPPMAFKKDIAKEVADGILSSGYVAMVCQKIKKDE